MCCLVRGRVLETRAVVIPKCDVCSDLESGRAGTTARVAPGCSHGPARSPARARRRPGTARGPDKPRRRKRNGNRFVCECLCAARPCDTESDSATFNNIQPHMTAHSARVPRVLDMFRAQRNGSGTEQSAACCAARAPHACLARAADARRMRMCTTASSIVRRTAPRAPTSGPVGHP